LASQLFSFQGPCRSLRHITILLRCYQLILTTNFATFLFLLEHFFQYPPASRQEFYLNTTGYLLSSSHFLVISHLVCFSLRSDRNVILSSLTVWCQSASFWYFLRPTSSFFFLVSGRNIILPSMTVFCQPANSWLFSVRFIFSSADRICILPPSPAACQPTSSWFSYRFLLLISFQAGVLSYHRDRLL
jgi:hypothetical protein